MTNESELLCIDQDYIDALKTIGYIEDQISTEQLTAFLRENLTPQEKEAFDAFGVELERLFLYGEGEEPKGICADLVKCAPEYEIIPKQVEREMMQQLLRAEEEEKLNQLKTEEANAKLIDALTAEKLSYDDYKFIDFIGERDEVVTRGLRDRSPTTRTNSARVHKPSGARDALPTGCRLGLLLFPPQKSRHRRRAEVQKVCGLAHFAEMPPQTHVDPIPTAPCHASAAQGLTYK